MGIVFLAILALGLLIVVHEAGHYVVARLSGMRVERFSLGFGPAIVKWRHKGTQFQIAPIPFGGFVQIVGMNPHEEYDEKDPSVYPNRPALLRFLTIFAGPFTNLLTASVLVFIVYVGAGAETYTGRIQVQDVTKDAPAEGRFLPGDVVVGIEGTPVNAPAAFREHVQKAEGRPMKVTVLREGKEKEITVTPRKAPSGDWLIGVALGRESERRPVSIGTAAVKSVEYTVVTSQAILSGLWDIVRRKVDPEVVGVVGMTAAIGEQIRAGWVRALEFLALLNVYLGLFNLLPLPALDGSRLAFLAYELATRRRPNPKVETAVHMAGTVVLLIIMVLVMFKDIKKVVG